MGYGAQIGVVIVEITERSPQQLEQFRFVMIALSTNLQKLDKIGRRLSTQIRLANAGERIFHNNFGQRVQRRFPAGHDGNFRLEKEIELPGKRCFRPPRALGDSLNTTQRLSAPGDDKTGVAKFALA